MHITRTGTRFIRHCWLLATLLLVPGLAFASSELPQYNFTAHWAAWLAVGLFVFAYLLVIGEEFLHLRKSKPTMVAAGLIWTIVALVFANSGDTHSAEVIIKHNLEEYGELFLFLLAAMTYINTMEERRVFDALRAWLVTRGFSLRTIFWVTGLLAFFISPIADNLTTALLMATVAMAVGGSNTAFIAAACINIVIAANAGGAFSPFGDITTLMVWQKGMVQFNEFFDLFLPSAVNWLVPAFLISLSIGKAAPEPCEEAVIMKRGARRVVALFFVTIALAVSAHNFLHLPPVVGMMTGLGLLKFFDYFLERTAGHGRYSPPMGDTALELEGKELADAQGAGFNVFHSMQRAEWDTLMFFYGIILCVGGLGALGYLALASKLMYIDLGITEANILVGLLSAVIDNIPVMFAVLSITRIWTTVSGCWSR